MSAEATLVRNGRKGRRVAEPPRVDRVQGVPPHPVTLVCPGTSAQTAANGGMADSGSIRTNPAGRGRRRCARGAGPVETARWHRAVRALHAPRYTSECARDSLLQAVGSGMTSVAARPTRHWLGAAPAEAGRERSAEAMCGRGGV
jgi:hypothetical protein